MDAAARIRRKMCILHVETVHTISVLEFNQLMLLACAAVCSVLTLGISRRVREWSRVFMSTLHEGSNQCSDSLYRGFNQ